MTLNKIFRIVILLQPILIGIYAVYFSSFRELDPILDSWEYIANSEPIPLTVDILLSALAITYLISLIMLFFYYKYGRHLYLAYFVISIIYSIVDTSPIIFTNIDSLLLQLLATLNGITLAMIYLSPINKNF